MTVLGNYVPGVAFGESEVFTPPNLLLAGGPAPTRVSEGLTATDLAAYSLVGIVTETNMLVLSSATATDGSQNPVGITTRAVAVEDSNSAFVSSNSAGGAAGVEGVTYYIDGGFNYDAITKGDGWTLNLLRNRLAQTGTGITVDQPGTATPTELT